MSRAQTRFTQADVARAIKGAKAAGMDVSRVEVMPDGRIVLAAPTPVSEPVNALDRWIQEQVNAG